MRTLLRLAILGTAIAQMAAGDVLYGVFCLVALAITMIPCLMTRKLDSGLPLELDLVLLWLMVTDMTLGNGFGLYARIPWYDKALHLSSSTLVGVIGFLVVYVLHLTGRIRFHARLDTLAILLIALGVGAIWEIGEYAVDRLFGRWTQGAPTFEPLDDTMIDLMLDALGGVIGGIAGSWYIRHSKRSRERVEAVARELAERVRIKDERRRCPPGSRRRRSGPRSGGVSLTRARRG